MNFSQRIGKKPSAKDLQLKSIDDELRNRLWNLVKICVIDRASNRSDFYSTDNLNTIAGFLWHDYYKKPINDIPGTDYGIEKTIRENFFSSEWNEVYDLVEFFSELPLEFIDSNQLRNAVNNVLEEEFAGYRFINGLIAPISNELEVKEIEEALLQNNYYTSLGGANIHLSKALDKLSDKHNPDYRNSIKESISAVETTCRVLTGESTLGKALNSLERKGIKINKQLKSGFEKIYAYTNDPGSGIRHAIIDEHSNPDFDDAKYMLVTCSAFINYLIGKCKTLGIPIQ